MKFPEDTIPNVKLSKTLRAALIREAETVVRATIQANEAFLDGGSRFLLPTGDSHNKNAISVPTSTGHRSGEVEAKREIAHGSTRDYRWKPRRLHVRLVSHYRGDVEIEKLWFTKELPSVLPGIMQQRDFLLIEATGLTRDSKGEKVGYFLMHSVSLPGIFPDLSQLGLVREEISACYIDRQLGSNQVEMYCRSFLNPRGKPLNRLTAVLAAEALLSAICILDYAYIRKLKWLVKNKQDRMSARRCRTRRQSGAFPRSTRCQVCDKSFRRLALNVGAECQICRGLVCKNCFVVKKVTVDVSRRGPAKQCAVRVCVCCLLEAKEKSVWEMALDGISDTRSEASSSMA
ncbi:hypothetical protein PI124_g13700 [Phytophthora idaei]|nr:hypothetical protein PI126_g12118 [Phytophthora idaei]KAG3241436.1 hypothetical protein PI124_g13700 [Phytophthora idaei]